MQDLMNAIAITIVIVGILYLVFIHGREEVAKWRKPLPYTPESRASKARDDCSEWLDSF